MSDDYVRGLYKGLNKNNIVLCKDCKFYRLDKAALLTGVNRHMCDVERINYVTGETYTTEERCYCMNHDGTCRYFKNAE